MAEPEPERTTFKRLNMLSHKSYAELVQLLRKRYDFMSALVSALPSSARSATFIQQTLVAILGTTG